MITVTDEMVEAAQHELKYIRYGLRDAEMRMAIQAALLASDALAVSGWQPIETAPRGKHLLFFPKLTGRNAMGEVIKVDLYPVDYPRKPTHWQPLPAPPVTADIEAQRA